MANAADNGDGADTGGAADTTATPLVAAYRHDVHKLQGRAHASAADTYHGVRVNDPVPCGADVDAARLSRPDGDQEQTAANHNSPYRLSLLTGETAATTDRIKTAAGGGFEELVTPEDPEQLHARWLTSAVPGAFNESVYYPYTSLNYHTLLTAALLDAYRAGHDFDELWLVATRTESEVTESWDAAAAVASDDVTPHRTVLWTPALSLHVTPTPRDRPAAGLGRTPTRSFADTWARLPAHPIDVDGGRCWRLLDAQLRRIRSWSVALAFIDEFVAAYAPTVDAADHGRGDGT